MHTEDGSIISKCLDGEPEAFGILVDKYKSGIYAFVYAKLGNFRDAQEITQDVFVEAYCKLHTLRRWESLAFWLYRIASNLCGKRLRDRVRHPEHEFIEDQAPGTLETSFIHSYQQEQMSQTIREAMDSLPEIYREVLILYYFGGMTSKDIAKALGTSPTAILQRLTRARAQLKEDIVKMIGASFESKRLGSSFTFRIVEAVKRINPNPVSVTKGVPWGISLATGIIVAFLSIGTHLTSFNKVETMSGFPLPSEARVQEIGEIPVDILKVSNISVISNQHLSGNGLGSTVSSLQNALFMAPQAGDTWTKKADMPTAKVGCTASTVNEKIYVIGGYANFAYSTITEEYDPKTDKWLKKADMITPKAFHTTTAVKEKIYVIGGGNVSGLVTNTEEYNPKNDTWTKKAPMPSAIGNHASIAIDDKIYVFGGILQGLVPSLSFYVYDPAIDQWEQLEDVPPLFHMENPSVFYVDNKIYCFGGSNDTNSTMQSNVIVYDIQTRQWSMKSKLPFQRMGMAGNLIGRNIYLVGGYNSPFNPLGLDTVEKYNIDTDSWEKEPPMPTSRCYHASALIDNQIYVIGGTTDWLNEGWPRIYLDDNEVFIPDEQFSVNPKDKLSSTWGNIKSNK